MFHCTLYTDMPALTIYRWPLQSSMINHLPLAPLEHSNPTIECYPWPRDTSCYPRPFPTHDAWHDTRILVMLPHPRYHYSNGCRQCTLCGACGKRHAATPWAGSQTSVLRAPLPHKTSQWRGRCRTCRAVRLSFPFHRFCIA